MPGPQGATGDVGPQGPPGASGAAGPAGEIELVVCKTVTVTTGSGAHKHHLKRQKCQTTLESGPVSFTASGSVKASLRRGGRTYATGVLKGGRLVLNAQASLRPGTYTLVLTRGERSVRESVTIR
jgi:hypothetical protein